MRVSTHEGSASGRLGGKGCSEAAEADCPTKAGRAVVGSVEEEGLRTTPSLARGVRPESSRDAMTLGHGRPPDRSQGREGTRRLHVQVIPRMMKHVLKDGLGIRDKRAIKGKFRIEARRKEVDRRIAPNAKQ